MWLVLLGFILPGVPYLFIGEYKKFAMIFPLLYLTFIIGHLFFNGAVVFPAEYQSPPGFFNPLGYLTFFCQMLFGLPAWLSLLWSSLHPEIEYMGLEVHRTYPPLFDLGSYYLLVIGGLNYYCNIKLYDHRFRKKKI